MVLAFGVVLDSNCQQLLAEYVEKWSYSEDAIACGRAWGFRKQKGSLPGQPCPVDY